MIIPILLIFPFITGYRFGDPLNEEQDSLHSDDESTGHHDDSDEFADDEGMSNQDSSSQEYLDDSNYLDDDDDDDESYSQFLAPPNQLRIRPKYAG